jgi:hypothetical protein
VTADGDGFTVSIDGRVLARVVWNNVGRVVTFKLDLGTYDEIVLQFDVRDIAGPVEVSEVYGGFTELRVAMERHLPGIGLDWYPNVMLPAFAENYAVIFQRTSWPEGV